MSGEALMQFAALIAYIHKPSGSRLNCIHTFAAHYSNDG